MRFIHTSDWQIGKLFGFVDQAAELLRDERLEAVARIGLLAREEAATAVLVAGDVYDVQTPLERTLRQPIERMRAFADIHWYLIPGNHDPHTPRGPWERLARMADLPANIHLCLTPEPVALASGEAWVLPAVLTQSHAATDPTAPMDLAATPEGALRIGLAHGSMTRFGTDPGSTHNVIAIDRPQRAGLAYLALGDWHGAQDFGERTWYSGTPETDDFGTGGSGGGEALLVELEGSRATPVVQRRRVGRFKWHNVEAALHGAADVEVLEARLRALGSGDLSTALVWLRARGTLSLGERLDFETRIRDGVGSALRVLRIDAASLLPRPTAADLEAIDYAGFVRTAADRLSTRAADPADPEQALAAAALQRLYLLHMRWSEGGRR